MEDTGNPGDWPGQALNTAHFQYQALKLFPETGCICIHSDSIFILQQNTPTQKKKSHPSILLWTVP